MIILHDTVFVIAMIIERYNFMAQCKSSNDNNRLVYSSSTQWNEDVVTTAYDFQGKLVLSFGADLLTVKHCVE